MSIACFAVYMQQILEQYGLPQPDTSREPTHWMKVITFGCVPSEGRRSVPPVGPAAFISRSSSSEVITSFSVA